MKRVLGIALSMVGNQALTSLLGLVFWTLAARWLAATQVGTAVAAIALMTLLGNLGTLGLGTLLIARIPGADAATRRVLVRTCAAAAGVAGTLLGLLVPLVVVGWAGAENLRPLVASPLAIATMALATGLTSLTVVLDQAVLTIGAGTLQVERNLVACVVKIAAFVALGGWTDALVIVVAWTIGNLVSLPLLAWRTRGGATADALVRPRLLRGLARDAAGHHVLNLALQAPSQLLPIIVTVLVSAQDNAYFGQALMIVSFVFMLPYAISFGLFAAGAGGEAELRERMRRTVPAGIGVSIAANVALLPLGGIALSAFGPDYALHGSFVLTLLALAGPALVIKDHLVSLRRVQQRTAEIATLSTALLVVELAAAAFGAWQGGITGVAVMWVITLYVEAAALAPLLMQRRAPISRRAPSPTVAR